jgi:hypothetical protein
MNNKSRRDAIILSLESRVESEPRRGEIIHYPKNKYATNIAANIPAKSATSPAVTA